MKYHSRHLGAGIAGKEDAARLTSNPAVREMIAHLDESGIETLLDRLESQQPQCGFGLRGLCCRMCQWGPCRITAKSPRGVCGRTMEVVAAANLLRAAAAGTSAQTIHAHEMILTLQAVARGEISLSTKGMARLRDVGSALNVAYSWTPMTEVTESVAAVMLEDLGRMTAGSLRTLQFAPRERRKVWEDLGLLPRSAAFEVLEAMHMTTLGACSDPRVMIEQALRTSLAYAYSGLVTSSVISDILFGIPEPVEAEVNFGVLRADSVNILVHGHSPVMLEKLLEKVSSAEILELAHEAGAADIVIGGMCCTGHEALARHGVPTVTGAMGQELVLGTGAVDAVVVDMQCVLPGIQAVASCFGTEIVTTCRSNRIPGATHIPFDPEHPGTLDEDALRIARAAITAFSTRDRSKIHIPAHKTRVVTGFSREAIFKAFGHARNLLAHLREGRIRGVVAMVACSTPKAGYETAHVEIARALIREGVLIVSSGCSAHALLNAGLCSADALADAAPGLRDACEAAGVPPVLVVGSCSDNTRIIQLFAVLAHYAELPMAQLPLALSGPELANEKTVGQMLAVLSHGITAVVGLTPQLPIPALDSDGPCGDTGEQPGTNAITEFFEGDGLFSMVGSRLHVRPDTADAVATILAILDAKHAAWIAEEDLEV